MLYVDTSAILKYYRTEKGTDYITEVIEGAEAGKHKLISSIWLILECTAAIQSWLARRWITEDVKDELISKLHSDFDLWTSIGSLILEDVHRVLIVEATALITKHSIDPGNAIHLATAIRWKNQIKAILTSDKHLKTAAEKEKIKVIDPEEK
ncbi:MAG: hypothetical protein DRP08_01600 [Candidatus Aenigmatarchaeota archaeon]|nr:MAG: hypothetical protein DRP08_01600 [Candidatus Aenigmarchaeota archaeon]